MEKPNDKPLVSVIIPAYNNAEELEKTLETVLCQTYCKLEIIVTDDGSEVDLLPIITAANDSRISYSKTAHANANVARNSGIRKSTGEYIAMLDSGDFWQKEHVEECLDLLAQSGTDGLYGSLVCTKGIYEQFCPARELIPGETMAEYLISTGAGAQTSTLFMTASSIKDILWDENLNRHQDYDLVIRYAQKYRWIAKTKATAIHPLIPRKDYDFDACIRFINRYKSEIANNILTRYYREIRKYWNT
jgi:glycosyltransferase involved in cell wall biosynthesis